MEWNDLATLLTLGIGELFGKDLELLGMVENERTSCAKLACYLEHQVCHLRGQISPADWEQLRKLRVDVEYNRNLRSETKRVSLSNQQVVTYNDKDILIPDIVIHERLTDDHNLLAVEVTGSTRWTAKSRLHNMRKIIALVSEYGYRFGLYLCLTTGANAPGVTQALLLTKEACSKVHYEERKQDVAVITYWHDYLDQSSTRDRAEEAEGVVSEVLSKYKLSDVFRELLPERYRQQDRNPRLFR
jgi:hypothetical protein